tara:strand:+ start:328 stop:1284 length:957 start_codon:yes stop_codon:yes gene_type:complete
MNNIENDSLATCGYKRWSHFFEENDLDKISEQVWNFYNAAASEGIFCSKEEALEIGLIRERDGQIINARLEPDYSGPKISLHYEDNIMYHELDWFFQSQTYKKLIDYMVELTGPDLDMCIAKLIITLPVNLFPDYVQELYLPMEGKTRGSLIPFIKEKYRKAFFFAHNPWHQDTIDYPESDNYAYTTLLSLTHRSGEQAPLFFCPESSSLGDVPFPLDHCIEGDTMDYRNDQGRFKLKVERANLEPGDLICWHAYNFHEVQPCFAEEPAVALRYNFAPSFRNNGLYDKRNILPARRSLLSQITEAGGKSTDHIRISTS